MTNPPPSTSGASHGKIGESDSNGNANANMSDQDDGSDIRSEASDLVYPIFLI